MLNLNQLQCQKQSISPLCQNMPLFQPLVTPMGMDTYGQYQVVTPNYYLQYVYNQKEMEGETKTNSKEGSEDGGSLTFTKWPSTAIDSCECQPTPPVCQCDESATPLIGNPMYSPMQVQQPTYVQYANYPVPVTQYYPQPQPVVQTLTQTQPVHCEKQKKKGFKSPKSLIVRDGIANNPKNRSFVVKQRDALLDYLMNTVKSEDEIVIKGQAKKLRKGSNYMRENFRGSRLRGISKNKKKWQVLVTLFYVKEYSGAYESEMEAALAYDKKAILIYGLKAKTNFDYSQRQIQDFLSQDKYLGSGHTQ